MRLRSGRFVAHILGRHLVLVQSEAWNESLRVGFRNASTIRPHSCRVEACVRGWVSRYRGGSRGQIRGRGVSLRIWRRHSLLKYLIITDKTELCDTFRCQDLKKKERFFRTRAGKSLDSKRGKHQRCYPYHFAAPKTTLGMKCPDIRATDVTNRRLLAYVVNAQAHIGTLLIANGSKGRPQITANSSKDR